MPVLPITVRNKVATYTGDTAYICGNSDYTVVFTLDAEWDGYGLKTARFVYGKSFVDVVFDGTVCTFPKIENANHIQVGIFAGDLHTTTGASIRACPSIRSAGGAPEEPEPDVYDQLISRLDNLEQNGVPQDKVEQAVEKYLDENPIEGTSFTPGNAVELTQDNVLNVRTTDKMETDNTLPITSAGVYTVVGNINALLKTI
jgi:hypothetical protein